MNDINVKVGKESVFALTNEKLGFHNSDFLTNKKVVISSTVFKHKYVHKMLR